MHAIHGHCQKILPARRYSLARYWLRPEVRHVYVRLSVCHKSVFYRNVWTSQTGFVIDAAASVLQGNVCIAKNKGSFLWNLS